ncbi:MAG TPA: hypothetical protein QGH71_02235 [Candidatus Marinimicrobia bacterium]|jgi:hypothetical protein|nr:hypothetical protein [Candidatus Neomarinimicrobiota bacterium]HJL74862.1 hypothetical protein [Candidatus Neomarinimicrobiota bacterium]HJM85404.1 hypothetical protein [Candidatus Neomarinimicrobiota bacterium]|tara:strand:- start:2005 stop:2397 length:393 start_codon:yes stop_codon:yes gene_type:complete
MRRSIVLLLAMILTGCYPVSHIVVGETKSPISPSQVKILLEYPDEYEIIARIDASSEFAFKDPSIDITWQSKMDKIIERLKIEAAQLGANGIVIENTDNKNKQNISVGKEETTVNDSHYKTATATAIFIK